MTPGERKRIQLKRLAAEINDDLQAVDRERVISWELAEELDEYRRFQHMFRHAYAGELRWRKMSHLAENLDTVFILVKNSLRDFNKFVLNLAQQV